MTVKRPSFPSRRVEFMKRNRAARKLAEKDKLARVSLPSQHIGKMNGRNDAAKLGEDDETDRATIDSQEQAGAVPSSAQQAVEALLTDEVNTHTVSDVARRDDDPDFDPQDMWTADIASLLSADPTNSPLPQRGPSSTAHTSASPKSVKKQPKLRHLLHRPRERNREASIGYFFHKIRRRQLWDTEVKKEEASPDPTPDHTPAPDVAHAPQFRGVPVEGRRACSPTDEVEQSCSPMDLSQLSYVVDVPGSFERSQSLYLRLAGVSQEDYEARRRTRDDMVSEPNASRKRRTTEEGGPAMEVSRKRQKITREAECSGTESHGGRSYADQAKS